MDKKMDSISKVMLDLLEISNDLVFEHPKITLIGRDELYLENHKGIIQYGPHLIKISISRGFLEIEGERLEIKALMPDELHIRGYIYMLRYYD